MNGGKGICSTRSDDCTFLNNTSVANCWQPNQQEMAHELSIRGARNVVQNNIAVGLLPKAAGMLVLPEYSGPMGNVQIDPNTIACDHNLFFNLQTAACVVLNRLAPDLATGGFRVRVVSDWIKVGRVCFAPVMEKD
jgi:hypothetical protein